MRKLVTVLLMALTATVILSLEIPYQNFHGETFVRLEHGAGTPAMARALRQAGVIRFEWQFWLERALHSTARLQAGEYRFTGESTVRQVFGRIAQGDVYFFQVSIPEGSNMFDIAGVLESAGAMPAADFLRAASDPALIRDLDPNARTLEGYLFPATYRLTHSTTAPDLCQMMTAQFRKQWKKLAGSESVRPHDAVTLASMVEKETGIAEERPLVAGVFANRLRIGMNLDCDPTTIYAALLENHYRGTIYRSDLDRHSAYNTYQNAGLPPGPIANPGAESIAAALHPADTGYLYFVARKSGGGHTFSSTLAAHEKAVQSYRHGSQSHKQAPKAARKAG